MVAGEETFLFADLIGEGFAGFFDWEVGARVTLTVLVLAGAFTLRWVVGRAIRRRFGTEGASGGGGLAETARDDRHGACWPGKIAGYVVWAVAVLLVFLIWTEFGRRAGFVAPRR